MPAITFVSPLAAPPGAKQHDILTQAQVGCKCTNCSDQWEGWVVGEDGNLYCYACGWW
jgi:hypothetical protein